MDVLNKSDKMASILQIIAKHISKKTAITFTFETFSTALQKLEPTYPFLKYITIEKTTDEYEPSSITVQSEIEMMDANEIGNAISEIFSYILQLIRINEEYVLLNLTDIKKDIESECLRLLHELNVNLTVEMGASRLNSMVRQEWKIRRGSEEDQKEFAQEIKKAITKNSEILETIINVLITILKRESSDNNTLLKIIDIIKSFEKKYFFLEYILIEKTPDADGRYLVRAMFDIDDVTLINSLDRNMATARYRIDEVLESEMGEAVQELIEIVGLSCKIKTRLVFMNKFKDELGDKKIILLQNIGIDFDYIEKRLREEGYYFLTKRIFEILIGMIGSSTSTSFAVAAIDKILKDLNDDHYDVLKYVSVDRSRYGEGIDAVNVMSELDLIDAKKLRKVIKDILKKVQENRENRAEKEKFVRLFKEQLGEKYVGELEKIGVNLYILELRFI